MKKNKIIPKVLITLTLCIVLYFIFPPDDKGTNLESVDWLPSEATNITYHFESQFGWTREYVCTIDEKAFRNFAKQKSWPLEPVKNEYLSFRNIFKDGVHIDKGLAYIKRKGGGSFCIHYDLVTQKLYHIETHR